MSLDPDAFADFVHDVHGYRPFRWQHDLLDRVLADGWPEVVDVPTGMGKTGLVDIAVFALALDSLRPAAERQAPLRTFMIVDRRLIVDQTHRHARRLASALAEASDNAATPVVRDVAAALLARCAGALEPRPLAVTRMRGGLTWDARWLRTPAQPAVITGTVDQTGSRLLFRGYGVSPGSRPIDAALVGSDSLIVLDEAHLAWPFVQTVQRVRQHERSATTPVLDERRLPAPVLLSATPPMGLAAPGAPFRPDLRQEDSDTARQRLGVTRPVALVDLKTPKKADHQAVLASVLSRLAAQAVTSGYRRVLVVANTVALARGVFDRLHYAPPLGPDGDTADRALLIGRARQVDKDRIARQVLTRLDADVAAEPGDASGPIVLVATQTVEVGADIDVDLLVSEAAPLDALLQRLGRVDRRGRRGTGPAVVVQDANHHDPAPVYGEATGRTWEWLVDQAGGVGSVKPDRVDLGATLAAAVLDLGPSALAADLDPATRTSLAAETPRAPVLLPPVIDAWAQTSPVPEPDQPVAPFLHGLQPSRPEVTICWRAGLPSPQSADDLEVWREEIRTAPPASHEQVAVHIGVATRFLDGQAAPGGADLEGALGEEDDDPFEEFQPVEGVIVGMDGEVRRLDASLRPGETVVLPATAGGHDEWGWTGVLRDHVVTDVADLDPGRPRLRVRADVIGGLLGGPGGDLGAAVRGLPSPADDEAAPSVRTIVDQILPHVGAHGVAERGRAAYADELARMLDRLRVGATLVTAGTWTRHPWWVLKGARSSSAGDGEGSTEADALTSSRSGGPVDLDVHLRDVEQRARAIGTAVGLRDELVDTVALAGLAHDLGKADVRFQAMLYGGDPLRAEATGRQLAKSGMDPGDRGAFRRAFRRSGLPAGFRHEALSERLLRGLLEDDPGLADGMDRDLLLHLVASHHGYGRPMPRPVLDRQPRMTVASLPGVAAEGKAGTDGIGVDWSAPSRFRRLGARYGWWGLALLETVLRLADMEVSREYDLPDDMGEQP